GRGPGRLVRDPRPGIRGHRGPVGLWQVHDPQHDRRARRADVGRGGDRRYPCGRLGALAGRVRLPEGHRVPVAHGGPQHRGRARVPGGAARRGAAPRPRCDRAGRPQRIRGRLPGHAVGWHAAARGAHAHARDRAADLVDGRAVRRARHPHQAQPARRAARPVGRATTDGRVRDARPVGGDHAGRSHRGHDPPARAHQAHPRGGAAAAARRDPAARARRVRPGVRRHLARARRRVRGAGVMSERTRVLLWRLAILIVLVGAWEWLTGVRAISRTPGLYWIDPFFISRPSLILKRFAYLASGQVRLSIWQMALSTVQSTLWGFVVGVSTGFAAGLILGRNDRLARIFEPYIVAFNSLPRIALVPLITMIFGFGLVAKIVLAWTIVFFIVFFNTFQGARSVDADLIHSARFLGGSDRQIMRTVIVPSALAWTFASLTPSISFALIGVVVGEFLGGESGGGLGYLIIQSLGTLNAADMMVALISLGVIGI